MRHVPISEFKDNASEWIALAERGEEIILTRHGKPAAKLVATGVDNAERERRARRAWDILAENREAMRAAGKTATIEQMIAWKNEGRQ